jgi:hypothetical protein
MLSLLLSTVVQLQTPVVRVGYCPLGWYGSGAYCLPRSSKSPPLVEKRGACPLGWSSAGRYCRE